KIVTGTGSANFQVREYVGSTKVAELTMPKVQLTSNWQMLTADFVSTTSGSHIDFNVLDTPVASTEAFLVDNVAIRIVSGSEETAPPAGASATSGGEPGPASGAVAPAPVRLRAFVSPDPMRSRATLSFTIGQTGPLEVTVYDAAGRRVRELWNNRD